MTYENFAVSLCPVTESEYSNAMTIFLNTFDQEPDFDLNWYMEYTYEDSYNLGYWDDYTELLLAVAINNLFCEETEDWKIESGCVVKDIHWEDSKIVDLKIEECDDGAKDFLAKYNIKVK